MKSVMQHVFSQIPKVEIPRSVFDRSHCHKTTFDAGQLIPFYIDEALPGDTFKARTSILARLATPIVPIMDNLFLETFYFAVPLRLIWENWQRFCGEQTDPDDSTDFLVPQIESPEGGFAEGSLFDYFGLPIKLAVGNTVSVSAFWSRAYNLIWNEWFRDQNVFDSLTVDKDDGPDAVADYSIAYRGKRHDYFTSCLPWPQKGPAVTMPLGTSAPVWGLSDESMNLFDGTSKYGVCGNGVSYGLAAKTSAYLSYPGYTATGGSGPAADKVLNLLPKEEADPEAGERSGLYADLQEATAATINSFREAMQLQRMLERDARGGSRYTEIVRSHFGVISPDSRLQRPEYLGGSSMRINVHPVQQTSSTDGTSPQGNLAAYGLCADSSGGFSKSFTEHCVIIGLVNVRADLTYQQGIPRMFSRQTRHDFYWPALAHLGEQAVLCKEIFADGSSQDEVVFGYQERYAEYRYNPSKITGKMRTDATGSLDVWHLSQYFPLCPTVTAPEFMTDIPPIDRVIAVPSEPHIIFDSFIDLKCIRPMPVYSVPGLVDHF